MATDEASTSSEARNRDFLPRRRHEMPVLRDALSRLIDGVWRGGKNEARPCFTIPADSDRDADLLLSAALTELKALREVANAAKVHYHDGPSPVTNIALGDALRAYEAFKPGTTATAAMRAAEGEDA